MPSRRLSRFRRSTDNRSFYPAPGHAHDAQWSTIPDARCAKCVVKSSHHRVSYCIQSLPLQNSLWYWIYELFVYCWYKTSVTVPIVYECIASNYSKTAETVIVMYATNITVHVVHSELVGMLENVFIYACTSMYHALYLDIIMYCWSAVRWHEWDCVNYQKALVWSGFLIVMITVPIAHIIKSFHSSFNIHPSCSLLLPVILESVCVTKNLYALCCGCDGWLWYSYSNNILLKM